MPACSRAGSDSQTNTATNPATSARTNSPADRVRAAHVAEPDATNGRIGELAGVSLATVKRHRPSRVDGSSSGLLAAQTPINGETVKVGR